MRSSDERVLRQLPDKEGERKGHLANGKADARTRSMMRGPRKQRFRLGVHPNSVVAPQNTGYASGTSSGIPVRCPEGQGIGTLYVLMPVESADPRICGLALLAVQRIEGQLAGEGAIAHEELLVGMDNPLTTVTGISSLPICQAGLSSIRRAIVSRTQEELCLGQARQQLMDPVRAQAERDWER